MTRTWYKIVNEDKPDVFKTLFHGVNKSRVLEFGKWLKAELKQVKDGTSNTTYLSGWHIEECVEYLKVFKHTNKKRI